MDRRHDLDGLRAVAMLLGILLHAALSMVPFGWSVQDVSRSRLLGFPVELIHGFRMPLFFLISGFFTAMLWRKRGLGQLLWHRFRRIFLPLVIGVCTISPLLFSIDHFVRTHAKTGVRPVAGIQSQWQAIHSGEWPAVVRFLFKIPILHHLWFLWFLCLLVLVFVVYSWLLRWLRVLEWLPRRLVASPLSLLWLIPLTMLPQAMMSAGSFGPDTHAGLLPLPQIVFYYGIFFFFGALYWDFDDVAGQLFRGWWVYLILGIVIVYPLSLVVRGQPFRQLAWQPLGFNFLQAVYVWAMTLGVMGCFHRFCSRESKLMRYVSDSSYWLYVAHLPLVLLGQWIVSDWPLPIWLKLGVLTATISLILLVTYEYGVRYTPIGTMLNGRRKRPNLSDQA